MESTGVPGRIQVSLSTYGLLREHYEFEARGEIEVKGKGKMQTYFLVE
jgi:class 3 adenylate cyclase